MPLFGFFNAFYAHFASNFTLFTFSKAFWTLVLHFRNFEVLYTNYFKSECKENRYFYDLKGAE